MRWIVGIENAFVPDMGVDQPGWTRHRERWRQDLALAVEAGADAIRYGVTWPEVAIAALVQDGTFDTLLEQAGIPGSGGGLEDR